MAPRDWDYSDFVEAVDDDAYRIGRLVAIAGWASRLAQGTPSKEPDDEWLHLMQRVTVSPHAYGPRLARYTQDRIGKVRRRSPEDAEALQALTASVWAAMPVEWPAKLTKEQDARWPAGMYAQEAVLARGLLDASRRTADEALERAKAAAAGLVRSGTSEAEAARVVGLDRMTVRKALGK